MVDVSGICGGDEQDSDSLKSLAAGLAESVSTLTLCFPDVGVEVIGFSHERVYVSSGTSLVCIALDLPAGATSHSALALWLTIGIQS